MSKFVSFGTKAFIRKDEIEAYNWEEKGDYVKINVIMRDRVIDGTFDQETALEILTIFRRTVH